MGISGCDGKIFTGVAVADDSKTGKVNLTDPSLLNLLSEAGYLPVISSVSMDEKGAALNINADEAALAVASSIPADSLIFISDIPGILKNNEVIHKLTPSQIRAGNRCRGHLRRYDTQGGIIRQSIERRCKYSNNRRIQ